MKARKIILILVLIAVSFAFIHALAYGILIGAGWLTNDLSFAKYIYQQSKGAINLVAVIYTILALIHYTVENLLSTKK